MKVTVYNPNGLQLLLPNFDEPMDVDVKPNVQASQTGTPDQPNVHEEYAFTEKVTRRIRFRKKLEILSGVAARKHMKVRYAGSQICLLEVGFERNVGYKRYVLRGWPEFLKDHGISDGDFCYFRQMEVANISSFRDLDVSRDDYTLKVRIVRLWRQPMFKNPSQTFSIEMILVDEEGNKVQASVLHKWFTRFERFLCEKATLIIKKPTIGDNSAAFKYVDNPLKVCLYYNTSITKCNDFNGPLYGFSFTGFQTILEQTVSESGSIDVIGLVVKYYKIEDIITKNGKQAFKLNFHMQDLE